MERRAVLERRRTRTLLIGSAALAALVLVAWFPGGPLLQQHAALAATNSALSTLRHQDSALALEQKRLNTPSEIERIARQQYDLVLPGQAAFQVLPPNGPATGADAPYPGDPGLAAPVSPSGTSELAGGGLSVSTPAAAHRDGGRLAHTAAAATAAGGVFSRIVRTLEFWR
jgi:cell division protein FtsB